MSCFSASCKVCSSDGETAFIRSYENVRPRVAPSCATSFTVAKRSSLAMSESRKVVGVASGGNGPVSL